MIPLRDDNPTHITPVITVGLIVACCLAFLWQLGLSDADTRAALYSYCVYRLVLLGDGVLPPEIYRVPATMTVFTSMFLHGGWMHLIGNMLYLWIFGNNIEDAMGHGRFIAFYLLCGVAAALAQALAAPESNIPMIGASGAIAGVLGGYLLLHPRARVLTLIFLGIFITTVRLPAMIVLGGWIGLQVINAALSPVDQGGVAWLAHIGGFVAGVVLIGFFKHPHVPFFDRQRPGPWG